ECASVQSLIAFRPLSPIKRQGSWSTVAPRTPAGKRGLMGLTQRSDTIRPLNDECHCTTLDWSRTVRPRASAVVCSKDFLTAHLNRSSGCGNADQIRRSGVSAGHCPATRSEVVLLENDVDPEA